MEIKGRQQEMCRGPQNKLGASQKGGSWWTGLCRQGGVFWKQTVGSVWPVKVRFALQVPPPRQRVEDMGWLLGEAELWSGSQEGDVAPPTPRSAPQYLLCADENHNWSRYRPTAGRGQSLPSSTGTQTRAANPHREVRERKRVLCLGRKEGAPGRYTCPCCFFLLGSGRRLSTL